MSQSLLLIHATNEGQTIFSRITSQPHPSRIARLAVRRVVSTSPKQDCSARNAKGECQSLLIHATNKGQTNFFSDHVSTSPKQDRKFGHSKTKTTEQPCHWNQTDLAKHKWTLQCLSMAVLTMSDEESVAELLAKNDGGRVQCSAKQQQRDRTSFDWHDGHGRSLVTQPRTRGVQENETRSRNH